MTEDELIQLCEEKINVVALNHDEGELSERREKVLDHYRGEPYGDEQEGFSKFVTREVYETVEWAKPHFFRFLFSSDKPCEWLPYGPEDAPLAAEETDVVNYVINRQRFTPLHDWVHNGLLYNNAYIKVCVEKNRHSEHEYYEGITDEEFIELTQDDAVMVLQDEIRTIVLDPFASDPLRLVNRSKMPEAPPPREVALHDVLIERRIEKTEINYHCIPAEEVLVDSSHASIDLDTASFVCHRVARTVSDLLDEGYDPKIVEKAKNSTGSRDYRWNTERVNRLRFAEQDPNRQNSEAPGMEYVTVDECYIRVDFDGDGYAELRKVVKVDDLLLENEYCSLMPIVAWSVNPQPNDHVGYSLAESVMDLQRLSSTLTRQLLNNVYRMNVKRKFVNARSLDTFALDLLSNPQTEIIPVEGAPAEAIFPEPHQSIVQELLPVMQSVADMRKVRSGIAPEISLNPEVLQDSTASAFASATDQASARIEMMVRIFAETGLRKLFQKIHQALRMYRDVPLVMELRGEIVSSDPSQWRQRTDVQINVGVGFNSRQQKVDMMLQVLGLQEKAIALGLANPRTVYKALEKLIDAAGVGHVSEVFVNPMTPEYQPPQPPPDPNLIVAQAEMLKVQNQMQIESNKMVLQMRTELAKSQIEVMKAQADLEKVRTETQIKVAQLMADSQKADVEAKFKAREQALKEVLGRATVLLQQQQAIKTRAEAEAVGVQISDVVREAENVIQAADEVINESPEQAE